MVEWPKCRIVDLGVPIMNGAMEPQEQVITYWDHEAHGRREPERLPPLIHHPEARPGHAHHLGRRAADGLEDLLGVQGGGDELAESRERAPGWPDGHEGGLGAMAPPRAISREPKSTGFAK